MPSSGASYTIHIHLRVHLPAGAVRYFFCRMAKGQPDDNFRDHIENYSGCAISYALLRLDIKEEIGKTGRKNTVPFFPCVWLFHYINILFLSLNTVSLLCSNSGVSGSRFLTLHRPRYMEMVNNYCGTLSNLSDLKQYIIQWIVGV